MICLTCRIARHTHCPGGTWCDCQNKPRRADELDRRVAADRLLRQDELKRLGRRAG